MFTQSVQCTGIVLTKLDGTAKGGAIFAIKQKLGLPVKYIGVGETLDDLEPFDPDSFVAALFE
jgi:fused signal recognition particle receptor